MEQSWTTYKKCLYERAYVSCLQCRNISDNNFSACFIDSRHLSILRHIQTKKIKSKTLLQSSNVFKLA